MPDSAPNDLPKLPFEEWCRMVYMLQTVRTMGYLVYPDVRQNRKSEIRLQGRFLKAQFCIETQIIAIDRILLREYDFSMHFLPRGPVNLDASPSDPGVYFEPDWRVETLTREQWEVYADSLKLWSDHLRRIGSVVKRVQCGEKISRTLRKLSKLTKIREELHAIVSRQHPDWADTATLFNGPRVPTSFRNN